ncbi:hypothetical protein H6F46_11930 [Limnothrix sp. FACHB-1083]|uniref:hypothetical protein n=1 Tax=unclassified Limnothrix TaxID=2632864 RepID=UPI0016817D5C|nr:MULTISPECIES: hypothetical protein [unclassified Limnothrix]MBD2161399.1 hypothetical protein [Limnothrix sp. FACHB-1083]MBD2192089.1 hypothetical protein [Limnothrix sp. FACHB-1088]
MDKTALTDATGWCWESINGFWVAHIGSIPIATVMATDTHAGGIIRAKGIETKSGTITDVLDWLERRSPDATRMMSR